jgi:Tfp pilus assembly protein PilN
MIYPNLASRPFLNTRPVWLVTVVAVLVTLVLVVINVQLYRGSKRSLAEQRAQRDQLAAQHRQVEGEVRQELGVLGKVQWRTLSRQVDGLNVILSEHSFSWLDLLDDIEGVLPYQVRLTRIAPSIGTEGVTLSLFGISRTREAMLEFLENLFADERFGDPLPKYEVTPEEATSVGYEFTLAVDYQPQGMEEVRP